MLLSTLTAVFYLYVPIPTQCSFELRLTILTSHVFNLTLYLVFYLCKLKKNKEMFICRIYIKNFMSSITKKSIKYQFSSKMR